MSRPLTKTQQKILEAGIDEFLAKGFPAASLRQIASKAGVTTGAFYGCFPSKDALFAAIVEPCYSQIMDRFIQMQEQFTKLPESKQQSHMGVESTQYILWMIDYIYDHYIPCKLLICCSQSTHYAGFINEMVEIEEEYTDRYMNVLRSLGHEVREIDPQTIHLIVSALFEGIFEILRHDYLRDHARKAVLQFMEFYQAGWNKIMEP